MVLPRRRILKNLSATLDITHNLVIRSVHIIHVSLEVHHAFRTNITPVASA